MKLSLLIAAAFSLLVGCAPREEADLGLVSDPQPVVQGSDPNAIAIGEGSAIAVTPYLVHDEFEGSTILDVDDIRAEDPTIVRVEKASRAYQMNGPGSPSENALVLVGLVPGHTVLHLFQDGDDVGSVAIEVVAQDPS
ncbi:MAG TPA: hypothetical protein VIF62_08320 [Labilithrix sp.]